MPDVKMVQQAKKNSIVLANYMIDHAHIGGKYLAYQREEKMLYIYNGMIYEPFEEIDLEKFFHDFMVEYGITDIWKTNRLKEIEKAMRVNDNVPRVKMNDYDNLLCLKNGILNIDTMELLPHSPGFYFNSIVDVAYDPTASDKPKAFIETMHGIFRNRDGTIDADTVDMIRKIGGYLIFPKNKLRKMFLLLGEGANGKSILINTFRMFFAEDEVTYMTLEQLSSRGFERSQLTHSRLNLSTEAKGSEIDSEELKKIIYGEGVTINKKFKEQVSFIPNTKIVIASNSRPYFNDTTFGMERRLVIISFNNRFVRPEEYEKYVNPETIGVYLAVDDDELTNAIVAEKTQILNYFISGLQDLKNDNWQLNETENTRLTKRDYIKSNDTVGSWLTENYMVDKYGVCKPITVMELLQEYREWYGANVSTRSLNYSTISMGAKIKDVFRIEPSRVILDGKKQTAYKLARIGYEENTEPIKDDSEPGQGDLSFE